MSSERAEQSAAPDHQPGVPGRVLATQREAMGWSVEQVADQLKLAVRQVVALEAGDYEHLPSPAVTRGFVRAYAKLLKMDPAPLVAQIAMDTPPTPDSSATVTRRASPASFSASKFPSHGKRSALPLGWIAGAIVVVAAAAAGAWHFGLVPAHRGGDAAVATLAPAASSAAASDPASAGASGSAGETLQNPSVPLISVPGPGSAAPAASAPANAPAPATAPVTAPAAPPAPATAAAQPATAGANALVLNVRADSWIEVRPVKGGKALISRLVKAGSVETIDVDQPVRLVVGNPGAVNATLRGAAVALPTVPGKTLARVNLQ